MSLRPLGYAEQQRNPAKHLAGIGFVVLLHALLVWALLSGLGRKVVDVVKAPLETKIIQEVKPPPPETRPPPPPKLALPPPAFIPPPEIQIAEPVEAPKTITTVTTARIATPQASSGPVRTAPVIDARRGCPQPEYPSASRRLEESGTVVLRFLIDVDGHVVDSKVEQSSGHDRLDQAARTALGRCRFKPGTVDGKPEQSWATIRYTWKLS